MQIMISLNEILLVFQSLTEQYIVSRLQTYVSVVKDQERYDWFEMVSQLEIEDCMSEQEDIPLVPVQPAEVSVLDKGALDILSSLEKQFSDSDSGHIENNMDETYYHFSDDDVPPVEGYWEETEINNEDRLTLHDLEQTPVPYEEASEHYAVITSSKISDNKQGLQQWVVTVVGKEDNYLHVTDGQRIWVKVSRKDSCEINLRDILLLDIKRDKDEVIVQRILTLETQVTEEYMIPDEHVENVNSIAI